MVVVGKKSSMMTSCWRYPAVQCTVYIESGQCGSLTSFGPNRMIFYQETMNAIDWKWRGSGLLIIDDLIQSIDESVTSIFTIYSHHLNVTCILLVQSLFLSSKEYRTIILNANYIILMKSVRNSSAVTQLAKQTHPYR